MSRYAHWRFLLTPGLLVFWLIFIPTTVFGSDHLDPAQVVVIPPLPEVSPDLAPSLTDGYHQETAFPTTTEKWIDVDLSEQRVVAYEGRDPVRAFLVSSGLPRTPTVTGEFRIRMKVRSQTMSGPGYYLPNVEWVQYFYEDYAFHGTYWHNNFGQPMSSGCVNMTNEDAQWLFDWASPTFEDDGPTWQRTGKENPGTLVVVHE
jgi:lipoprotein-anchoring transpeptidase ErfK/SrfK